MSQDARKTQGLELTPTEEQFLARQVNELCVCAHVMTVVCAWVSVLIGNCSHWMHGVSFTHLQWAATGWIQQIECTVSDSSRPTQEATFSQLRTTLRLLQQAK